MSAPRGSGAEERGKDQEAQQAGGWGGLSACGHCGYRVVAEAGPGWQNVRRHCPKAPLAPACLGVAGPQSCSRKETEAEPGRRPLDPQPALTLPHLSWRSAAFVLTGAKAFRVRGAFTQDPLRGERGLVSLQVGLWPGDTTACRSCVASSGVRAPFPPCTPGAPSPPPRAAISFPGTLVAIHPGHVQTPVHPSPCCAR